MVNPHHASLTNRNDLLKARVNIVKNKQTMLQCCCSHFKQVTTYVKLKLSVIKLYKNSPHYVPQPVLLGYSRVPSKKP